MVNLPQTKMWTALEIALGVLVPVAGLVIAAILLATGHRRPAAYVLVAALVGVAFWGALLL
jgi:hypothetical protein